MNPTLRKLETMLNEAAARGTWGGIEIELKDGKPTVIRQTIQTKAADEDTPNATNRK
jgi:hypothetical protein